MNATNLALRATTKALKGQTDKVILIIPKW